MLLRPAITALLLATTPAAAQEICMAPIGPVDPCVVGHWVGTTSAPAEIDAVLLGQANVIDSRTDMISAPEIGMVVRSDGFTRTLQMGLMTSLEAMDTDGSVFIDTSIRIGEEYSWMTAERGTMSGCLAGAPADIGGHVTISNSEGAVGGDITAPMGGGDFMPVQTYTCTARTLEIVTALPAPLGNTVRTFTRVPASRFPGE
ncbi:hypothetical protein HKCCE3408_00835 [Rhodobacterales bacterium HKCCE3408]|nr:hypothetical protein [Rhodobacterales bacterium HKCCE3408]